MLLQLKKCSRFTWMVCVFTTLISFMGIFMNDFYRDNDLIKSVWRGNDVITLFIALPLLLFSMRQVLKNPSKHIKLLFVWMGCLWYMIYNYVFYVYGAAFNIFFLGYILIIVASTLGLLHGLLAIKKEIPHIISENNLQRSYKGTSIFLLFFGTFIGGMWIALSASFLFTGVVPTAITQTDHPTGVVFASDLIFLVTPLILLSYYVSKKNIWAIILTPIILVKCSLYPLVLVVAGIFAYIETGYYDVLTPFYLLLGSGAAYVLLTILRRLTYETASH